MDWSLREKGLLTTLLAELGVAAWYFSQVLQPWPAWGAAVEAVHVGRFVQAVVLLVVLEIVSKTVLALAARRDSEEPLDERDRLIAQRGTRVAYGVLSFGVVCALGAGVFTPGNFLFTHLLYGALVLAGCLDATVRLFHYRQGL